MSDILVVVDVQNDFITGSLGSEAAVDVLPNIVEKIKNHEGDVVYTMDTHHNDYLSTQEGRNLPIEHCICDTEGWMLADEVYDLPNRNAHVIEKDSFGTAKLTHWIYSRPDFNKDIHIELIGYVLDICVISNALLLKSVFPEVKITVDASCCAATSPEAFDAAVTVLKSCQVEVIQ